MRKPSTSFRFSPDLLARVDVVRGDVPRTRWIERAIEARLPKTEPVQCWKCGYVVMPDDPGMRVQYPTRPPQYAHAECPVVVRMEPEEVERAFKAWIGDPRVVEEPSE